MQDHLIQINVNIKVEMNEQIIKINKYKFRALSCVNI